MSNFRVPHTKKSLNEGKNSAVHTIYALIRIMKIV